MLDKVRFLKSYGVDRDKFEAAGLVWPELNAIHKDYLEARSEFEAMGDYIVSRLRRIPEVHSLKVRTKDPEHLVEKIVRKRISDSARVITAGNYRTEITDLVGVRALHLFKDDWLPIHEAIAGTWAFHESPVANIRRGDPERLIDQLKEKGCEIKEHEQGYRSIHYLIVSQPAKGAFITEIQVRTIFEEGWSEIDHRIRYPYDLGNVVLGQFLVIFNRLAGSADEMGSFVQFLKAELESREATAAQAIKEKNGLINQLKAQVKSLQIKDDQKEKLGYSLDQLSTSWGQDLKIVFPPDPSSVTSVNLSNLSAIPSSLSDYSNLVSSLSSNLSNVISSNMISSLPISTNYSNVLSSILSSPGQLGGARSPSDIEAKQAAKPVTSQPAANVVTAKRTQANRGKAKASSPHASQVEPGESIKRGDDLATSTRSEKERSARSRRKQPKKGNNRRVSKRKTRKS